MSSDLETNIVAVERVQEYSETDKEVPIQLYMSFFSLTKKKISSYYIKILCICSNPLAPKYCVLMYLYLKCKL